MTTTSRPPTPDSPNVSFHKATATIDDLTAALANFTHTHSTDPPGVATCCCGRDNCENSRCWAAFRTKLEERLVFSAEVGQALLERHEAYVRRQESSLTDTSIPVEVTINQTEEVDARVADLVRENAVLEKRLSQALVNNEVIEVTHHKVLEEMQELKDKMTQLTMHNVRLVGVDTRLVRALQEKDDLQQERNSATQRAKLSEARVASLKEKCAKLQAQVGRLREDLETQRSFRKELSEEVLSEARARLQHLQQLDVGSSSIADDTEVTKVLESLVADNEALKRDNAELQNLLGEAREDLRGLQEEVNEQRADRSYFRHRPDDSIDSSTLHDQHSPLSPVFHVGTAPATSLMHSTPGRPYATPSSSRRAVSIEREMRRGSEPLTPETNRRPLSPTESVLATGPRWSTLRAHTLYAPSHLSLEAEGHSGEQLADPAPEGPRPPKSLLLLMRSRAVQTDGTNTSRDTLDPSPVPRTLGDLSQDGQSESSSLADNNTTVIGVLVERVALLLNRLMQADALTLTTRLKRQHLLGADVSHLSRNTVSGILNEANALRAQFRAFLEDDRITSTCTRRDLRALFKLFKDMFSEMGQLRVTLNDVILDPTVAGKVSDMAMHPSKPGSATTGNASSPGASSTPSWMAPLTKLLGLPGNSGADEAAVRALSPPARPSGRLPSKPPVRFVPKREPALSASVMTVNVEFSGAGVGRAITTTAAAEPSSEMSTLTASASTNSQLSQPSNSEAPRSVMDIFAGAPRATDSADPWVVVPKPRRIGHVGGQTNMAGSFTVGRSAARSTSVANLRKASGLGTAGREAGQKLSRIVDAVIDTPQSPQMGIEDASEARDVVPDRLLERTLRPRGLSDSSIHTTFMNHGSVSEDIGNEPHANLIEKADKQSVLQTLSRTMQSFRLASSSSVAPTRPVSVEGTSSRAADVDGTRRTTPGAGTTQGANFGNTRTSALSRATSPGNGLLQSLTFSSWAAATSPSAVDEIGEDPDPGRPRPFYVGTAREESAIKREWSRGREI